MKKRALVAVVATVATVGAILLGYFIFVFRDDTSQTEVGRFSNRELVLPDDSYRVPSVEDQLLQPRIHPFIDPEAPLDSETADRLKRDLPAALRRRLTVDLEREIEELLFHGE